MKNKAYKLIAVTVFFIIMMSFCVLADTESEVFLPDRVGIAADETYAEEETCAETAMVETQSQDTTYIIEEERVDEQEHTHPDTAWASYSVASIITTVMIGIVVLVALFIIGLVVVVCVFIIKLLRR